MTDSLSVDVHDETALIAGIRAGNDRMLADFDQRFRPRLLAAAQKRRLARQDAEDVVQDVLIAAATQIREGRFKRETSLGAWVWSIFIRRVSDLQRKAIRHERLFVEHETPEALANATWRRSPATVADVSDRVREALSYLPVRERLILLLNVQEGRPAREIAVLLRLRPKTVEALLTAAKKRFRAHFAAVQEIGPLKRLKD